jgi:2-polyprenyl-3-methyl-5-hydroxy-6-metoxy-1,4-benzoquinol methylase
MKFFNIDLHISVIRDISSIFKILDSDIEIHQKTWSGHSKFVGMKPWESKHINAQNWKTALTSPETIKNFIDEYDSMFSEYDGFIVTHTPALALLFSHLNKPIIVVNSCRYDQPFCWETNSKKRQALRANLSYTLNMINSKGNLYISSNNEADAAYLLQGTTLQTKVIPSICHYVGENSFSTETRAKKFFIHGSISSKIFLTVPFPHNYTFYDISSQCWGVVFLPYEVSTMTFFELQTIGVPVFLPSKAFFKELISNGKCRLQSDYTVETDHHLGNDFWLDRSDYYGSYAKNLFPGVTYFHSISHLNEILKNITFEEILSLSTKMRVGTSTRTIIAHEYYQKVIQNISNMYIPAKVFSRIYRTNQWGADHGEGSSIEYSKVFLKFLNSFVHALRIRSISDIGCGYSNMMKILMKDHIGVDYIGCDAVDFVIQNNKKYNTSHNMKFSVTECIKDTANIPICDLLICKDVLQHLPNKVVANILPKLRTRCRTLMIITDVLESSAKHYKSPNCAMGGDRVFVEGKYPLNVLDFVHVFSFGICKRVYICAGAPSE